MRHESDVVKRDFLMWLTGEQLVWVKCSEIGAVLSGEPSSTK